MSGVRLSEVVGARYRGFWETKKRYRVVKGGRASKKSCTAALYYIYNMMKYHHVYGAKPCLLVIRRYFNTHKNSTRAQLIWAIRRLGVERYWKTPRGEHTLTYLPSGQVVLFRGMDDPESLTSITVADGHLVWCWIEEAYQIHSEESFNKLDLSIRGDCPAPLFKQITLTLNPWSDLTWIKARFFDKPREDVFTDTTSYLGNEFLGEDDKKVFEAIKESSPRRYRIEGLGEWGVSDGLIYIDYAENPERNNIAAVPAKKKIAVVSCGLDYGTGAGDAPVGESRLGKTVIEASGVTEGFEEVYALEESYFNDFYRVDKIIEWVIEFLLRMREEYKVKVALFAEWAGSAALNNTIGYELLKRREAGVSVQPCYKGEIIDRIDLSQTLLAQKRLYFTDKVPGLKAAYKTALWDVERQKKLGRPFRLDNGTTDVDALDAHEYSLSTYAGTLLAKGYGVANNAK
jgi:PBSX family phage terminase large subunit